MLKNHVYLMVRNIRKTECNRTALDYGYKTHKYFHTGALTIHQYVALINALDDRLGFSSCIDIIAALRSCVDKQAHEQADYLLQKLMNKKGV